MFRSRLKIISETPSADVPKTEVLVAIFGRVVKLVRSSSEFERSREGFRISLVGDHSAIGFVSFSGGDPDIGVILPSIRSRNIHFVALVRHT